MTPWGCEKWWSQRGAPRSSSSWSKEEVTACPYPLPLPSESWRPGSFGFRFFAEIGRDEPAQDLRTALTGRNLDPDPYGALENPYRFLRNHIAMQIRKRRG